MRNAERPLAIYVHVPFCPSKCGYCDFNSYAMTGEIMGRTTDAIIREIERSPVRGRPAKTIFFGGGTPTFIPVEQLLAILDAVREAHPPVEDCEITSEANPGTVDASRFVAMREGGFNRISLGAQSFLDDDLLRLGRVHTSGEVERAVGAARSAGYDNVNLDLMFALPGQSMRGWRSNLDRAFALAPEHLSLYCLTIESNTPFHKLHLHGQLDLPDDEEQVAMYELACSLASEHGYGQYEISNFAKPGRECRHNLCYWRGEEYAGYGPGAVGSLRTPPPTPSPFAGTNHPENGERAQTRYTNLKHPERYCDVVERGEPIAYESEVLDESTRRVERIMLGLRLNEGLSIDGLMLDPARLVALQERRWIERQNGTIRLTPEGRHFCSEVALELI